MKVQAFKITNKVNNKAAFVEATSAEVVLDAFAKANGAERFEDLKCSIFGTDVPRALFAITPIFWKSYEVRGRFTSKEAAEEACKAKGVNIKTVSWYINK
jgi:hypothetical protein